MTIHSLRHPLLHRHDDASGHGSHGSGPNDSTHSHGHQHSHGQEHAHSHSDEHSHGEEDSHSHDHSHHHDYGADSAGLTVLPGDPEAHRVPLARGAGRGHVLHFDAFSGAAGDMCVAALVDLGVPFDVVRQAVDTLQLQGVQLELRTVLVGAIGATKFDVRVDAAQPQRSYRQIRELLERSPLEDGARALALGMFRRLAEAEAAVHRSPVDDVHFHEVGAVDSLADIVGAAACLDFLAPSSITCSPLPLGSGMVRCQHGLIPIPAPATLLCLGGLTTVASEVEAELVTPTGAAILGHVAKSERWPAMRPHRSGWGRGTRSFAERPNALRVVLGERVPPAEEAQATHVLLEANLDDATGEVLGHTIDALLHTGAVDAWVTPTVMKKGRPGWTLAALGDAALEGALADVILRETSSIGLRVSGRRRVEQPRTVIDVATRYGVVPVKISGATGDAAEHHKPEFGVCQELAQKHGVPPRLVVEAALIALSKAR